MDLNRSILLVWFFCFLFSNYNNNGVEGSSSFSKEDDIELEKQLKLLNKPAIKTIQTEYGDIYNCVDFYKQPAFDHPLLKNHSFHFQMRPSYVPKVTRDQKERSTTNMNITKVGFKRLGCPFGTVPIRRVTKDDLIRAKLHSDIYNSKNNSKFSVLTVDNPGTHYALVRTTFDIIRTRYNGGGAYISIYEPDIKSTQISSGRMKIKNDPDSIEVGWTVNPALYGSNKVRFYTYFKTNNSQCFNLQCPGFVKVNDFPLDSPLQASTRDGTIYYTNVFIYKDRANGNWWLDIDVDQYDNHKYYNRQPIGFWPKEIFTGLADSGFEVEWGGEVSGPPYIPSPPMGSSYFLTDDLDVEFDAHCHDLVLVNEAYFAHVAQNLEEFIDVDAYQAKDFGHGKGPPVKHIAFFGGPGGATGS